MRFLDTQEIKPRKLVEGESDRYIAERCLVVDDDVRPHTLVAEGLIHY